VSYSAVPANNPVTEANFSERILYTKSGNNYTLATSYSANTTYYIKLVSWRLTDIPSGITPENAT